MADDFCPQCGEAHKFNDTQDMVIFYPEWHCYNHLAVWCEKCQKFNRIFLQTERLLDVLGIIKRTGFFVEVHEDVRDEREALSETNGYEMDFWQVYTTPEERAQYGEDDDEQQDASGEGVYRSETPPEPQEAPHTPPELTATERRQLYDDLRRLEHGDTP